MTSKNDEFPTIIIRRDIVEAAESHLTDYVNEGRHQVHSRMNYQRSLAEHTRKMLKEALDKKPEQGDQNDNCR